MVGIPDEEDADDSLFQRSSLDCVPLAQTAPSHGSAGVTNHQQLRDRPVREPFAAAEVFRQVTSSVLQEDHDAQLEALPPVSGLSMVDVQEATRHRPTLLGNQSYYSPHRESGTPGLEDAEQATMIARRKYQPVREWAKKLLKAGESNHHCYSVSQPQFPKSSQAR